MASFERGEGRLEGIEQDEQAGGLLIQKKRKGGRDDDDEGVFKKPKASLLGLDALAREKRKQSSSKQEKASTHKVQKRKFDVTDDQDRGSIRVSFGSSRPGRRYRNPTDETPTYTGGVNQKALDRIASRSRKKDSGLYVSSGNAEKREGIDKRQSSRRGDDRMYTPNIKLSDMRTPSRSSWDGDNTKTPVRRSAWDTPTPAHLSSVDEPRWTGTHGSLDTPLPTPSHLYNDWANDRKSFGRPTKEGNVDDDDIKFSSMEDRIEWEDEQKRMDRAWYDLDSGYDDTNNPFANIPEEYTKKKEEKLMKTTVKRMSAQQRQLNKDNEKWETNRLLTSGIVQQVDVDDDFEDEAESKVHLLVSNVVPPFLDGRIVFTKQPEPVIPVKVSDTCGGT